MTLGSQADVDKAVAAARRAFDSFSQTSKGDRAALLGRIIEEYKKRIPDIAKAISEEMGAPITLSMTAQAGSGLGHFGSTLEALNGFEFEESTGKNRVIYEPIGVVALITPWNWPMNQIVAKVAPAIAAGNAVILKPSRADAGLGRDLRRGDGRRRRSGGRVQPRPGRRPRRRRRRSPAIPAST